MVESSVFGIVAGTLIGALVAYALRTYLKPLSGKGIAAALAALLALFAIKMGALFWFHGYFFDVDQFRQWALRINAVGPAHFYGPGYADVEYMPGGIYILWPFGSIGHALGVSWEHLRIVVAIPSLLADLAIALTMFAYLRRLGRSSVLAWAGMLLVALNPALLFDTVVWGQTDSEVTLLMWLATVVALEGEYVLAAAVLALAAQVKPHALILIPPLLCWVWRRDGFARLWIPIGAFVATTMVAVAPFAVSHPWDWVPRFYTGEMAAMPETSVNAFNLMAIVGGIRQPETAIVFGVSVFILGMSLVLAVVGLSCALVWRNPSGRYLILAIFIALFGEFLFGPRMHERYLYPAIVFFAPIALEGPFWLIIFALLTLSWLFNLAYVLHTLETVYWIPAHGASAMVASALNLMLFSAVLSRMTMLDAGSFEARRPTLAPDS